ncbi:MAG: efflux RND transporter periplasmic adaptor subunit [Myxococcota bacterium]
MFFNRRLEVFGALVGLAVVALLGWLWARPDSPIWVTAPITRATISHAIVTTGSVNPVTTVQVGSYVSGPIQKILCDYNKQVQAGQLCAKIDPRLYQQAVDQAKANLEAAIAQLHKDEAALEFLRANYRRDQGLVGTGAVSRNDVDLDRSNVGQAEAQVELDRATIAQRRAALHAAEVNLAYTDIISPVTGTVVSRNVDVGQTVAASFQTPTLFLIAKDLTEMQVDTNVSESDVGGAMVGQRATFTVDAHPDRTFEGKVVQVRRAPITVQNVVTYNVVVACDNPDLLLLPGMTADVRILVEEHADVPTVPEEALRFDPVAENAAGVVFGGETRSGAETGPRITERSRVFVLRDDEPVPVEVEIGLSDGTRTEIAGGALRPDDRVIVGIAAETRSGVGSRRRSPFGF